jgi:hypothetical protein
MLELVASRSVMGDIGIDVIIREYSFDRKFGNSRTSSSCTRGDRSIRDVRWLHLLRNKLFGAMIYLKLNWLVINSHHHY